MSLSRASFSTKARTWLLLAALTALFIGIGAALGGAFLWLFVVFCEVKAKSGSGYGDPLEMIGPEKLRRLWRAAEVWLAGRSDCRGLEVRFEAIAIREGRLRRVPLVL